MEIKRDLLSPVLTSEPKPSMRYSTTENLSLYDTLAFQHRDIYVFAFCYLWYKDEATGANFIF